MEFLQLQPFVPSGSDFEGSRQLFLALGFTERWNDGGYIGFQRDACQFILQDFKNREFAENFMISIRVSSADEFYQEVTEKALTQKFGIRIASPQNQPYGREVNLIDLAGVCWHFVEYP
jgi:hypothetical protein